MSTASLTLTTISHNWLFPASLTEAASVQKELAKRVVTEDAFTCPRLIAGMDVSNNPYDPTKLVYATVVALAAQDLSVIETSSVSEVQNFPYISGFLGFREAPVLLQAWQKLKQLPELIMIDGHGISHPRGLGIASHIGVLLDHPTIGVAKTILVGKPAGNLGPNPGDQVPLLWKGQQIATVLRTKARCNPLIISPGHKVSMAAAVKLVLQCLRGYRLPEPTRQAHLAANAIRRNCNDLHHLALRQASTLE